MALGFSLASGRGFPSDIPVIPLSCENVTSLVLIHWGTITSRTNILVVALDVVVNRRRNRDISFVPVAMSVLASL